jgi:hypothetical protein
MMKQQYPFCPHGEYVGGCGVDHMCFDCEMGTEQPTAAEQRDMIRRTYTTYALRAAAAMNYPIDSPEVRWNIPFFAASFVWKEAANHIRQQQRLLKLIEEWSSGPNDDRWLYTMHEARIAEWNAMQGEEQFDRLPAHVLDGA